MKQHEAQSKPIVDNDDAEMEDGEVPSPEYMERVEQEFLDVEKRRDRMLRLAEDAKRRKTEQPGEVGSGGKLFSGTSIVLARRKKSAFSISSC